MPVPEGTPALFLGRALFDRKKFRPDTDPAVIDFCALVAQTLQGAGWPSPAKKGDATVKMAVYAESDGMGAHLLWGGNPAEPRNPTPLVVSASGSATVNWQEEGVFVVSAGTVNFVGAGATVTDVAGVATVTIPGGGGGGTVTEAFKTISVSGQSDIVADLAADTLTVVAGTGIVVTTNAGTDTMTFAINTSVVAQNSFTTIAVSGQSNVVADSPTDTLTLVAAGLLAITTNASSDTVTFTVTGDGVGYDEIQEEGTPLTKRAKLNFISERVTAEDNPGAARTDVTFEYFIRVFGTTTDPVTAATSPFNVDAVEVIQGDMPELVADELEIVNVAKIPISDETEAEFRWNQRDERWETEPLKSHMVLGLATAGVSGGTFTIDNIELVCGSDPRTDPTDAAETLSVTNPFAWDIDDNGQVLATKKANGVWIAIQAACPA